MEELAIVAIFGLAALIVLIGLARVIARVVRK